MIKPRCEKASIGLATIWLAVFCVTGCGGKSASVAGTPPGIVISNQVDNTNYYERYQYRSRDWVIDAFNRNMPYDEFTIEQLAGDLLPKPTLDQIIATSFCGNNRLNTEGGAIPEEYHVEYVIDRVQTMSSVWLGLTTGCARCHDHKYDPISQKEFYSLCSYFNNVPETLIGEERPMNYPPLVKAPYPAQAVELARLTSEILSLQKRSRQKDSGKRGPSSNHEGGWP